MKISRYLLPFLLAGGALAADYDGVLNDQDGGVFAVEDGGYLLVENSNFTNCYSERLGGAIYVGAEGTLELKGSLEFANNFEYAWSDDVEWFGDANDVYLSPGATLVLNAESAEDVITLGSGVDAVDSSGTGKIVKKGAGVANLGGAGDTNDYSFFEGQLEVEQGSVVVKTDVNAVSAKIADGASVVVQGGSCLNLVKDYQNAVSAGAKDFDDETNLDAEGALSGTEMTLTSLRGGTLEDVAFTVYADSYEFDDLMLNNSVLHLSGESAELSNLIVSADSGIVSSATATLSGENYLVLGSASSNQLKGVTLADGVLLTLGCTPDILPSGEMGDTVVFDVILNGLQIAENANVTLAAGGVTTQSAELSITSWQVTEGGVSVSMSAKYVPEPATATLSLLALCGLAARRRRK